MSCRSPERETELNKPGNKAANQTKGANTQTRTKQKVLHCDDDFHHQSAEDHELGQADVVNVAAARQAGLHPLKQQLAVGVAETFKPGDRYGKVIRMT